MSFDSLQDVIEFQGDDYQTCYVPDVAQQVLDRWNPRAAHFECVHEQEFADGNR